MISCNDAKQNSKIGFHEPQLWHLFESPNAPFITLPHNRVMGVHSDPIHTDFIAYELSELPASPADAITSKLSRADLSVLRDWTGNGFTNYSLFDQIRIHATRDPNQFNRSGFSTKLRFVSDAIRTDGLGRTDIQIARTEIHSIMQQKMAAAAARARNPETAAAAALPDSVQALVNRMEQFEIEHWRKADAAIERIERLSPLAQALSHVHRTKPSPLAPTQTGSGGGSSSNAAAAASVAAPVLSGSHPFIPQAWTTAAYLNAKLSPNVGRLSPLAVIAFPPPYQHVILIVSSHAPVLVCYDTHNRCEVGIGGLSPAAADAVGSNTTLKDELRSVSSDHTQVLEYRADPLSSVWTYLVVIPRKVFVITVTPPIMGSDGSTATATTRGGGGGERPKFTVLQHPGLWLGDVLPPGPAVRATAACVITASASAPAISGGDEMSDADPADSPTANQTASLSGDDEADSRRVVIGTSIATVEVLKLQLVGGVYSIARVLPSLRGTPPGRGRSSLPVPISRMVGLPGGRIATAERGLIRLWHLDVVPSSNGIADTSELRCSEHLSGSLIIDLQIRAV